MKAMSEYPRKAYGAWAGRSRGVPYNKQYCAYEVWGGMGASHHQCSKPRGFGPDKIFCRIHDPVAIIMRRGAQTARWEQKTKRLNVPYEMIKELKANVKRLTEAFNKLYSVRGLMVPRDAGEKQVVDDIYDDARNIVKDLL